MRSGINLGESRGAGGSASLSRAEALARLRTRLERAGVHSPDRDAEWLLLHALGLTRAAFWSETRAPLRPEEIAALEALSDRREKREPLQHLLGDVPFHGVRLAVERGVFVPRPETEELVEAVLSTLGGEPSRGALLDWGTGTGAVALALLRALPGWTGVAADISPRAVALAVQNAARNGLGGRLRVIEADFAAADPHALPGSPFDLVVANPPYVRRGEIPGLMPEVRDHDPREALDGGEDGLDAHRHLARGLAFWLRPGGLLALEIGPDQADEVLELFGALIQDARVLPDGAGRPRIVIGTKRGDDA